ncbi:hypothetical protein ACET3Z_031005 [Daucus carota]
MGIIISRLQILLPPIYSLFKFQIARLALEKLLNNCAGKYAARDEASLANCSVAQQEDHQAIGLKLTWQCTLNGLLSRMGTLNEKFQNCAPSSLFWHTQLRIKVKKFWDMYVYQNGEQSGSRLEFFDNAGRYLTWLTA